MDANANARTSTEFHSLDMFFEEDFVMDPVLENKHSSTLESQSNIRDEEVISGNFVKSDVSRPLNVDISLPGHIDNTRKTSNTSVRRSSRFISVKSLVEADENFSDFFTSPTNTATESKNTRLNRSMNHSSSIRMNTEKFLNSSVQPKDSKASNKSSIDSIDYFSSVHEKKIPTSKISVVNSDKGKGKGQILKPINFLGKIKGEEKNFPERALTSSVSGRRRKASEPEVTRKNRILDQTAELHMHEDLNMSNDKRWTISIRYAIMLVAVLGIGVTSIISWILASFSSDAALLELSSDIIASRQEVIVYALAGSFSSIRATLSLFAAMGTLIHTAAPVVSKDEAPDATISTLFKILETQPSIKLLAITSNISDAIRGVLTLNTSQEILLHNYNGTYLPNEAVIFSTLAGANGTNQEYIFPELGENAWSMDPTLLNNPMATFQPSIKLLHSHWMGYVKPVPGGGMVYALYDMDAISFHLRSISLVQTFERVLLRLSRAVNRGGQLVIDPISGNIVACTLGLGICGQERIVSGKREPGSCLDLLAGSFLSENSTQRQLFASCQPVRLTLDDIVKRDSLASYSIEEIHRNVGGLDGVSGTLHQSTFSIGDVEYIMAVQLTNFRNETSDLILLNMVSKHIVMSSVNEMSRNTGAAVISIIIVGIGVILAIIFAITFPLAALANDMHRFSFTQINQSELMNFSRFKEVMKVQKNAAINSTTLRAYGDFVPRSHDIFLVESGVQERVATILISEIQDFANMAETKCDIASLLQALEEYLDIMSEVIITEDGHIVHFFGGEVMSAWNVLKRQSDHATNACTTALEQIERLQTLTESWEIRQLPQLDMRIGINTGPVLVGKNEYGRHQQIGVVGPHVQFAGILQSLNRSRYNTSVLLSGTTVSELSVDSNIVVCPVETVSVGILDRLPNILHELVGYASVLEDQENMRINEFKSIFELSIKAAGELNDSHRLSVITRIESYIDQFPLDHPAWLLLEKTVNKQPHLVIDDKVVV